MPRTIDICYTSDSFASIKETYESEAPLPPLLLGWLGNIKMDSLTVVVPYLTEFNHKKFSNEEGGVNLFLMDAHINNILGKYAYDSDEKYNELMDLFHVYIDSAHSFFNGSFNSTIYPIYYPIISNIYCFPDGIVIRARYSSSGFNVFFPNDKNAEVEIFGGWVE